MVFLNSYEICHCDHIEIKIHSFPYVSVITFTLTFLKLILVFFGNDSNKMYVVTAVYNLYLNFENYALNL